MSRLFPNVKSSIITNNRDIALITEPGMGLTNFLKDLDEIDKFPCLWIDVKDLNTYWESDFKDRQNYREKIIDYLVCEKLKTCGYLDIQSFDEEDDFKDILQLLGNCWIFTNSDKAFINVIIDNFDDLNDELAKEILDRIKILSNDQRKSKTNFIRFIIGGTINFEKYYKKSDPNSPATNFLKIYPNSFLLSDDDSHLFITDEFRKILKWDDILQIIIELSGGYFYYLLNLSNWCQSEFNNNFDGNPIEFIDRLQTLIIENPNHKLFRYCYAGWEQVKNNKKIIDRLKKAISSGTVFDPSGECNQAIYLGLLFQTDNLNPHFRIPNKIVELFIRQRLAEIKELPSIHEDYSWIINKNSLVAYREIKRIEIWLKRIIFDQIYKRYKKNPRDISSDIDIDINNIGKKIKKRREDNGKQALTSAYWSDPDLSFIQIEEISIHTYENLFNKEFATEFSLFIKDLCHLKKRVINFQLITQNQINTINSSWKRIEKKLLILDYSEISDHKSGI